MLSAGGAEHCSQASDPVLHVEEQMTVKQVARSRAHSDRSSHSSSGNNANHVSSGNQGNQEVNGKLSNHGTRGKNITMATMTT
jgi:hypothetical protein